MTELEQLLSATLERVSNEFSKLLEERDTAISSLSQQVLDLSKLVANLSEELQRQSADAVQHERKLREDLWRGLTLLRTQLNELVEA